MKSKIYLIFTLLFSLFTAELFAETSIAPYLDNDDEVLVSVSNGISYTSVLTEIDGDGSSESSAIKVYAPVDDGASSAHNLNGGNILSGAGNIRLRLEISNSMATAQYLTLAYQKDSKWYISSQESIGSATSNDDYFVDIPHSKVWNNPASKVESLYLYVFFTETPYSTVGAGEEIDESSLLVGGLYYRIYLSARTYAAAPYSTPTLHFVLKGDGRLYIQYTGELTPDAYKSVAIKLNAPSGSQDVATATSVGTIVDENYSSCSGGLQQIIVNNLINDLPYNMAVACVDKFNFATKFTASISGTPEPISAFLEKNACYFISAGFGEEHYVLAFFREFRDQVLLESSWGQDFVGWYYRTAPKYANIVYTSDSLSFMVRVASHCLYFILNFWKLIFALSALTIGATLFVLTRRNVNARLF